MQWKGQAHAYKVMSELDVLFRYTAMYLLGKKGLNIKEYMYASFHLNDFR